MAERSLSILKWSGQDIIRFLTIYRKYEELWDINNEKFTNKTARHNNFKQLVVELAEQGFYIPSEELLRKKIKNIKDAYRMEQNKVKQSLKSGLGAQDAYKPKLRWYNNADSFLNNVISGRESSSNQDDTMKLKRTVTDDRLTNGTGNQNVDDYTVGSHIIASASADNMHTYQAYQEAYFSMVNRKQVMAASQPQKKMKIKTGSLSYLSHSDQLHDIKSLRPLDEYDDEYYHFAMHIAFQLRQLPTRSFILLQERIQTMITQERLNALVTPDEQVHTTSSSFCSPTEPASTYPLHFAAVKLESADVNEIDFDENTQTDQTSIQEAMY